MAFRPQTSRLRYRQYREDLANHRTEGSSRTAAAHAKAKPRRSRTFNDLIIEFFKMLRGHRMLLGSALFMLSLATLLSLIPPYATKIVVDNVLGTQPLPDLLARLLSPDIDRRELLGVVTVVVIAISLASVAVGIWSRWQATRVTKLMQASIRKRLFEHAVRLPLHKIQRIKSGGVASILREDAGGVAELVFGMLYNPFKAIITLIGCLIVLAIVDWRMLLGSLILFPIIFLTHRTWISRIRPVWRDIRASRQEIDSHATEAFGGMRVVRTFGRQQSEANRFSRNNHLMIRQEILAWWWSRSVDLAWSILIPLASAALLYYGGLRVLDGSITTGDLVAFLAYLAMLLGPLATLATSATQFQNSLAGLDRVLDLMAQPQEMPSQPGMLHVRPETTAGRITLHNVSFAYPGTDRAGGAGHYAIDGASSNGQSKGIRHQALGTSQEHSGGTNHQIPSAQCLVSNASLVLSNINLNVNAGEMIALVGPSGAGKTTLCNLIARFYDPIEGSIELDGTDLREIDVDSYRRLLGIVEQDIFLFDGSIGENISYGARPSANVGLEEITHAAKLANAHQFISEMPHGYNTIIGERGVRLSGGQRQRLAIARALLADPRILILDEATSNLDTEVERLIQQSLHRLMKGRTSFVIAHRLSTIAHANRIIVIDHGRIIEQGTHDELMATSGRYRHMVKLQTGRNVEDAVESEA